MSFALTATRKSGHTDSPTGDVVEWIEHKAGSAATLETAFKVVTELWAVARPLTFIDIYNDNAT